MGFRHVAAVAFIALSAAACGSVAVEAPPPPPPPVAAPAEVATEQMQPCKNVSECRGEAPKVVGPCPEGHHSAAKWQCFHEHCVSMAVCD